MLLGITNPQSECWKRKG